MKRFAPVVLILVLVALVSVPAYRSLADAPKTATVQKWEYAELQDGDITKFATSEVMHLPIQGEGNPAQALLLKLGGKKFDLENPNDIGAFSRLKVALLDQIGTQGWELVSVSPTWKGVAEKGDNPTGHLYIFKRPAR